MISAERELDVPEGELAQRIKSLTAELNAIDPQVLRDYPVGRYVALLHSRPRFSGYSHLGPDVEQVCSNIISRRGTDGLAVYHKLVIFNLMRDCPRRRELERLPPSIRELVWREFRRIAGEVEYREPSFYGPRSDLFLKDLGICSLRLLPCGAEFVELYSGVPRRLLFNGGPRQFLRAAYFFFVKVRGFRPLCEFHMDTRALDEFTPQGWDRTYERLAELLKLNPHLKGVFGTAWFYDPAMEWVSPRLAYIRQRRQSYGAWNFRGDTTESVIGGALSKSETRRRLYHEGRYVPRGHYLVWSRGDVLKWARMRSTNGGTSISAQDEC